MDSDGANKHRITERESCVADIVAEAGGLMSRVHLSDGSVFSAEDATGSRDIHAFDARNGQRPRLAVWEGLDEMPSVDPQGDRVVFVSLLCGTVGPASAVTRCSSSRGMGTGPEDGDM